MGNDLDRLPSACCDGGPHLLVPERLISDWHGTRGAQGHDFRGTHYARACAVPEPLGVIPIGSGTGLVVAGSPPFTYWVEPDLVIPVFWNLDFNASDLREACRRTPTASFQDLDVVFENRDSRCFLIAACDSGPDWVYGSSLVELPPGRYRAFGAEVTPRSDLQLQVFRLSEERMSPRR